MRDAEVPALLSFFHYNHYLYRISEEELIVDQAWALNAIYATLGRKPGGPGRELLVLMGVCRCGDGAAGLTNEVPELGPKI